MVTKTNSFIAAPVSGETRSSIFDTWHPYVYSGIPCWETIDGTLNARVGSGWSGGGAMYLTRNITTYTPDQLKVVGYNFSGATETLHGTVRNMGPSGSVPPSLGVPTHPSYLSRLADGATAIARTEPTNPAFDLSVFLGELRAEGLPHLPGHALREKTRLAKASGSEYLSVEFGWAPLVRGVQQFAHTVNNSDKIIRSYQERANRVTQRRYQWPDVESSQAYACSHVSNPPGFFTGGGHSEHRFERKWFEAEYIYYLPTGNSINDKVRRYGSYARKLLGVTLSPEVLWNLSPWSWAADWFANTGDVMHNISALGTDGLVIRHAYVMHHTGLVTVDEGDFNGLKQYRQKRVNVQETKSRLGASPFGFGLTDADLTLKQKAIITALGLSRFG